MGWATSGMFRDVYGRLHEPGIDMHPAADPIWIVAGAAARGIVGSMRGAAGSAIKTSVRQVTIQSGHGARHLVGTGLTATEVEAAIKQSVGLITQKASTTGSFWG